MDVDPVSANIWAVNVAWVGGVDSEAWTSKNDLLDESRMRAMAIQIE